MEEYFFFEKKKYGIIALGEIMLRLSPPTNEMIIQSHIFDKQIGGSELNVVAGVESLGIRSGIISKIPHNELGRFVKKMVRSYGVTDDFLIYDDSSERRLGIYYYEYGAHPRKPTVIYDRTNSSFLGIGLNEIEESTYEQANIFHVSGITLGLSKKVSEIAINIMKKFKEKGTLISFDVNFRQALWSEEEAREVIERILPYIDILFVSEESLTKMFKKIGSLEKIIQDFSNEYNIKIIATTKRNVKSPKVHTFSSIIYSKKENKFYTEDSYYDIDVVDRIGSGDAYLSGVLFGILKYNNLQKAIEYGNAMSVLKNTTFGDISCVDAEVVEKAIRDHKLKGYSTEMNR